MHVKIFFKKVDIQMSGGTQPATMQKERNNKQRMNGSRNYAELALGCVIERFQTSCSLLHHSVLLVSFAQYLLSSIQPFLFSHRRQLVCAHRSMATDTTISTSQPQGCFCFPTRLFYPIFKLFLLGSFIPFFALISLLTSEFNLYDCALFLSLIVQRSVITK